MVLGKVHRAHTFTRRARYRRPGPATRVQVMAKGFGSLMAQASDEKDPEHRDGAGGAGMSGDKPDVRMTDSLVGRIIGTNFRVLKLIGTGAMGHVYQAEQMSLGKMVALKLLRSELMGDERLFKRFELEARNASRLSHPNSIQIIDFGRDQDLLYIAMELLQGVDLGQLILREGPLSLPRVGRIMDQALGALDEAHAQGIVHRDLKPSNIMLASRRGDPDFVKVCDFGIAKAQTSREGIGLTMKGLVCGTPEYMSPEQARGDEVDGRSDLYAVGVILYQLVTGDLPFTASSPVGILSKHLADLPQPPSLRKPGLALPVGLERVILACLAKEPADRPQGAEELRRQLRSILADLPERSTGPIPVSSWAALDRSVLPGQPTTPVTIAQPPRRPSPPDSAPVPSVVLSAGTTSVIRSPGRFVWSGLALLAALASGWVVLGTHGRKPAPTPPPALVQPAAGAAVAPIERLPPAADPAPDEGRNVIASRPAPDPAAEPDRPRRTVRRPRRTLAAPAAPAEPSAAEPAERPAAAPPSDLMAEAERLLAQGEVVGACEKGEAHKRMSPEEPRVHRFLGRCYMRAGQPERARESFRRYLELAADAPDGAFIKSIVK
jgi:eukaryotic-like serine/threonine-protein kinase